MRRPIRRATWIVPPLAAVCALAGCGGSSSPLQTVVHAANSSLSQSMLARVTMTSPRAFGGRPAQVTAVGAFLLGTAVSYERVDLPGPLDANKHAPRDFIDFVPATIYILPSSTSSLPAGKQWISVHVHDPPGADGVRFVAQAAALDPQLWLDELAWGSVAASSRGGIVVSHHPFSRYAVTVDLRRAANNATGPFARTAKLAIRQQLAALAGRARIQVNVWVDGAGRVAHMEGVVVGTKLGAMTILVEEYGFKVRPASPPPATIVPLIALVGLPGWTPSSPWVFAST